MTDTPTPSPAPRRSGWRRFFVGSALVLSGVIIGVGTSALSQGMHRGWSDDGFGRYERFDRDDRSDRFDGPRRFFREHGPRGWFGRDHDDDGPRGWHGRRFGGGDGDGFGHSFLTPGRIERMVSRLAWAVDASSEQKQKLMTIVQRAGDDLRPLRESRLDLRRQARDVLTAPSVDRGKLEALRTDMIKLADQASQRITGALAEAADVLTPEQREDLARRLDRFGPGRRG
jgi:Spy/CpxP family protein refolding chaperone